MLNVESSGSDSRATDDWQVEELYFGCGEYVTNRRKGERVQRLEDIPLGEKLEKGSYDGQYASAIDTTHADQIGEFVATHNDCQVVVCDGYDARPVYGGRHVPPIAYLRGWREINTLEGRALYEREKSTERSLWPGFYKDKDSHEQSH